ncbi:DUF559 domain-containing protein [Agromyces sp. LHK192]|uniref:DUF559 domain-containing protein n=1 Tax=Agromyces sp. LHK192 TaxID=2498704 RepID=UPI0013E3C8E4|nr:DUF559 domain-containing protein [Agromyces sp. LHK192]
MRIEDWLTTSGGIRHVDEALIAGYTRYAIRLAVHERRIERVRRSWIATRSAPWRLRRAASVSGRLACVTAAAEHGLWTIADERLHLAVAPNASRFDAGDAVIHWNPGPIRPHRFELIEPIDDALVHIAECRPIDDALVVWESAIRLGKVSVERLGALPLGSDRARRVRAEASELSDSGIETLPAVRLRRIGIPVRQQAVIDGHPVDGLIGERLAYQIDGFGPHSDRTRRRRDLAQDRRLALMGFTVLRFDYDQVMFEWPIVELQIRQAIAIGAHLVA